MAGLASSIFSGTLVEEKRNLKTDPASRFLAHLQSEESRNRPILSVDVSPNRCERNLEIALFLAVCFLYVHTLAATKASIHVEAPAANERIGCVLPGEGAGYSRLCRYARNDGYCPSGAMHGFGDVA
jgi:hypothetical protein